tara:strand:+ start:1708 stop:1857 length:150 start_codon:yes stop_codon:yes gene_type:complete
MLQRMKNGKKTVLISRDDKVSEQNLSITKILYHCDFPPQPAHSQQRIFD